MTVAEIDRQVKAEEALSKELGAYVGQWVAVRDHHVVAHAPILKELLEQTKEIEIDGTFRVPEEKTACFY